MARSCLRTEKTTSLTTSFDLRFRLNSVLVTSDPKELKEDWLHEVPRLHSQLRSVSSVTRLIQRPRYRFSSTWCAPVRHIWPSSCQFRSLKHRGRTPEAIGEARDFPEAKLFRQGSLCLDCVACRSSACGLCTPAKIGQRSRMRQAYKSDNHIFGLQFKNPGHGLAPIYTEQDGGQK